MTKLQAKHLKLLDRQVSLLEDLVDDIGIYSTEGLAEIRRGQAFEIRQLVGEIRNLIHEQSA
jgi:hypothetical protein